MSLTKAVLTSPDENPFGKPVYGVDGCNEPMFRIGYNTPLYTYTDERSAKAEP